MFDSISRRESFHVGALALGGLGLSDLMRLRSDAAATAKPNTGVILIWLEGGASHLDTYDPKPDAPSDYRGLFQTIATSVQGIRVSELLPMQARVAHRCAFIRSISHSNSQHAGGAGRMLTGRVPLKPLHPVSQFPTIGPIVAKIREPEFRGLPPYVANARNVYGGGSAYLGPQYLPFVVFRDPSEKDFQVRGLSLQPALERRIDDRVALLESLDRLKCVAERNGTMDAMNRFNQRAVEMLSNKAAQQAFDLTREPTELRDRYGRTIIGQRALMARRLVEAGCSFVTLKTSNLYLEWDDHPNFRHIFDSLKARVPAVDRAIATLIEDIFERGLDKRVMVVVAGEFGRTPRVGYSNGQPGRNHWPGAMSVLVAGGGVAGGQVIGSTTAKGEYAKDRRLDPNDLLATIYRFLDINYEAPLYDHQGRPMPILPHGKPIKELT